MTQAGLPLVLTQGDPAGIGPDITLAAWVQRGQQATPFYAIADADLLRRRATALGLDVPVREVHPTDAMAVFADALPVVPVSRRVRGLAGTPDPADAATTIESIERGVSDVRSGLASAVVTNPIAKHVLYAAGFAHPGHTEFLGALASRFWPGAPCDPVMMIWSEALAVVPLTIHVPLRDVPGLVTGELIARTARIVADALRRRFGVTHPRLACTGLNPHAGEDGSLGREEIEVIGPALEALRREGLDITGPWPGDAIFTAGARSHTDAILTMYHDQGLIPIKALAFDEGVNATLGLPFVRTSPDHGTAFGLAGQGLARPDSLMAALRLAARLAASTPVAVP